MNITHKFLVTVIILSLLLRWQPAQPAQAAGWVVTKTADTNDGVCNSDCSLREAVTAAGAGDTITFASALAGSTITLSSQIAITKNLTIDGSSLASYVEISGGGSVRVFEVSSGVTAFFHHLVIKNQ